MFDINLLKEPGLLDYNKNSSSTKVPKDYSVPVSEASSIGNQLSEVHIKGAKSYLLILVSIALFLLILGSILNHNKVDQSDNNNLKFKDLSINTLLTVLQKNNLYAHVNYINFSDEKISFESDILSEDIFYNFLDILGNHFSEEIRGIHKKNKFSITGVFPWSIKDSNNFNINFLNKEISDFGLDIKKEIYNDKLIIICGIQGAFELLNLIVDLNLIDQFHIEIKKIQSLPGQMDLFQIIIY